MFHVAKCCHLKISIVDLNYTRHAYVMHQHDRNEQRKINQMNKGKMSVEKSVTSIVAASQPEKFKSCSHFVCVC